jgi:hypothetical protein
MNQIKNNKWTMFALVAAALVFSGCASGTDTHNGHHASTGAKINVPNRSADIFAETDKHLQALAVAVKGKDARAVHEHDVAVRQLMAKLPELAAPDIKSHVDQHVREISEAAKSAHEAAHDDNWTKAESDVKTAQESLNHFRNHFKEKPQ